MYLLWSHMEEAWRDTLVHAAEGYAFVGMSTFYGYVWPRDEVSERAWRGSLHVMALGRRGTFWTTFRALESALSDLNEKFTVTIDSTLPNKLRRLDGDDFTYAHVGRYLRTPFGLLYTTGPSTGLPDDTIEICPVGTRYWDAPGYDVDTYDVTDVPVEMLPFLVYERTPGPVNVNSDEFFEGDPCLFEVEIFATGTVVDVPATYLFDDTMAWIVSSVDTGADTLTLNESYAVVPFGSPPSTVYQIQDATPLKLSLGGGATMPSPLVEGTTYYALADVDNVTIQLEASIGGGAIPLTTTGSGTIFIEVVQDPALPLGGHLLEDENEAGNDEAGGGPFPFYLYDGSAFSGVAASLQPTLPGGVHLRIGFNPLG